MLSTQRNIDEAGEHYRQYIPVVIDKVRRECEDSAEEVLKDVTRTITTQWIEMAPSRSKKRSPDWSISPDQRWRAMKKARKGEIKYELEIDCEDFEENRSAFERENRRRRRKFARRT